MSASSTSSHRHSSDAIGAGTGTAAAGPPSPAAAADEEGGPTADTSVELVLSTVERVGGVRDWAGQQLVIFYFSIVGYRFCEEKAGA